MAKMVTCASREVNRTNVVPFTNVLNPEALVGPFVDSSIKTSQIQLSINLIRFNSNIDYSFCVQLIDTRNFFLSTIAYTSPYNVAPNKTHRHDGELALSPALSDKVL
eukprot:scaffold70284_cov37-Attheya_sp.AAC.1